MNANLASPPGQPTEWLTPKQVQSIFKFGNTRFWQLVKDGAFPVSRPKSPTGRDLRIVRIRRSDVDAFMAGGYQTA
ncbi:helix-turn-helix domain-containing protein [Spirosoma sp. HMF3257]|uniref:Helix-turn-helix domain-containing protein n=1 Tax=Spirosoma telluris TaxID=2183553 RepID=A0A327NQJ4_9BACT|nr:helix-turn-helix domain-containing protein [Spirosoma telluris]RAI76044.1 hypothetical protein HMF3257_21015 [Spirosoma telluris]